MIFKEAYELPIGNHVEKKGKFNFLSWVYAVKYLRENYPEAQWIIHENVDQAPIFKAPKGYMVKVSVVVDGQPYTQWHPVLNYKNKPIEEPDCFEINTSIQRCLTKAIGLATGIGLGLYAGEDLPVDPEQKKEKFTSGDWEKKFDDYFVNPKSRTLEAIKEWRKNNGKEILDTISSKQEATKLKGFLNDMELLYGEDNKSKLQVNI